MPSDPELNFIYKIEAEVIVKKEMDRDELKTLKKRKVLLTSCYHEYFISSVLIFENEYYI